MPRHRKSPTRAARLFAAWRAGRITSRQLWAELAKHRRPSRRRNAARRVYAVRVYAYPLTSRKAFAAREVGAPPADVIGWGRTAEEAMREAEAHLDRPASKRRKRNPQRHKRPKGGW